MHTAHGKKIFMVFHRDHGLLIFIIFLCELFYFLEGVTVASYADDNYTLQC